MNLKKILLITGALSLMTFSNVTHAATAITGTAYGEGIGLIHMDYTTAERPAGYSGEQRNFFISPLDPAFTGPGLAPFTAHIYDMEDADEDEMLLCTTDSCPLTGFMWSDTIGWILLDGQQLPLEEADHARINFSGRLTGYIWSENTGWILLAKDPLGTNTPTESQNRDNWGVFFDPTADPVVFEGDEEEEDITLGRVFRGYAWSESLGWIKFGSTAGDSLAFNAYTRWLPDTTPPEFYLENDVWLTGNEFGFVSWPNIAFDGESGIREDTRITITKDPHPDFSACNPATVGHHINGNWLSLDIASIGFITDTDLGYCKYTLTGNITNNAGLSQSIAGGGDNSPITFYVRAGNYDETKSSFTLESTRAAVADGTAEIRYSINLLDAAGNPIRDILCTECPQRSVTVTGNFENSMRYDTTQPALNSFPLILNKDLNNFPLDHGITSAPAIGVMLDDGTEKYPLNLSSFAPTTIDSAIALLNIQVRILDDALPRITTNHNPTASAVSNYEIASPGGADLSFEPGLIVFNGEVKTGDVVSEVIDRTESTLEFSLKNNSSNRDLGNMDIDTIFEFYPSADLSETHSISHALASPTLDSPAVGWSPINGESARYEIYSGLLNPAPDNQPINGANSMFHESYPLYDNYDPETETFTTSTILTDGSYSVSEDYELPENQIDRNDKISMSLGRGAVSPTPHIIHFTPAFILPGDGDDVYLRIKQQIAYRYDNQSYFAIYEPATLISGIEVKTAGVSFQGLGSGDDVFTNGELDFVGKRSVNKLAEQMRRNAAELTLNRSGSGCTASNLLENAGGNLIFKTTPGNCIKVENNTVVALAEGTPDENLVLGDDSDATLLIPAGVRYTLILKGGINLLIKNNMYYSDSASSFGVIMLASNDNLGANVYLHPKPTNIVGNLYTEGSLLSSPDGNAFYYGGTADAKELKNQLYWQGSIASLNTIGGGKTKTVPNGVNCGNLAISQCAERYDMDFIRRFAATEDSVVNGGFFSGGGSCTEEGVCSLPGVLPSTVKLDGDHLNILGSKSLDAFFIEPANRPSPPGFSTTSGQESTEVIR